MITVKKIYGLLLFMCLMGGVFAQEGLDRMLGILEENENRLVDFEASILELEDFFIVSTNELDSKGQEIIELNKQYRWVVDYGEKAVASMENELDTYEAMLYTRLEDHCPEQEKYIENMIAQIEPILEQTRETNAILGSLDNRYDEKLMKKIFKQAGKACRKATDEVLLLYEMTVSLEYNCPETASEGVF